MKRETYLKIKKQKRKARLLAILTTLSLVSSIIKDNKVNAKENDNSNQKEQILELILEKAIYTDPNNNNNFSDDITNTHDSQTYSTNFANSYKNNTDISHRGYTPGKIYDNSKEGFKLAGENGFWGCEADVRFDQNGELVCSHNTVKSYENPLPFEEYLKICKEYGMTAIIDLKYERGPNQPDEKLSPSILNTIEKMGMINNCVLQTNNPIDISYIREISDEARIWYLTDVISDDNIELIKQNNVECVNILSSDYNAYRIKKLSDNEIDVCVWNVQTIKLKEHLLNIGAKYIMSDNVLGISNYTQSNNITTLSKEEVITSNVVSTDNEFYINALLKNILDNTNGKSR